MVANTIGNATFGGKTDWYVPSSGDITTAFDANGGGYYNTIVPFSQRNQSWLGTFHTGVDNGRSVPTRWFLGAYIYPFTYPAPFVNAQIQTSVEADPGQAITNNIVMDLDLNLNSFNKNSTPNQVFGIRYFNNNSQI